MLPSLSAGTFECGRPQIVFECSWCAITIEPQNLARRSSFGVCQEAAQPPMPSLIMAMVADSGMSADIVAPVRRDICFAGVQSK